MASGQTICQYGDVTIYRCELNRFHQEMVLDSSGTDLKCWKFTVVVTGYIHGQSSACVRHSVATGTTRSGSATDADVQIRWRLQPRQAFTLAMGCSTSVTDGKRLLYATPASSAVNEPDDLAVDRGIGGNVVTGLSFLDVNDGPKCLSFDLVHVAADNIFKVQATFEIYRVQCDDSDKAQNNQAGVLSHRWSSTDSLDYNLRATRTHRGIVELLTADFSPHWFRDITIPPLANGFRREHMQFTATEDGKKLLYAVIDQEIAIAAPYPARKWSVQHTEATLNQDGQMVGQSKCSVSLEGDSNCDKTELIFLGLNVITAKLVGAKVGDNLQGQNLNITFTDLVVTDFTGDVNAVQLSASAICKLAGINRDPQGNLLATPFIAMRQDGFRKIITSADLPQFAQPYDPRQSLGGRDGDAVEYSGPAGLMGIFRCYLQTPCDDTHQINNRTNQTNDLNDTLPNDPVATVDAVVVSTLGETTPDYYSTSQTSAPYTFYQCECVHRNEYVQAAMPVGTGSSYGAFDTTDATRAVSLCRPQARYLLRIHAERIGDWPEFPDPRSIGATYIGQPQFATANTDGTPDVQMRVLSSRVLRGTKTRTPTGRSRYRSRMEVVFILARMPYPNEVLKVGHDKYSTDDGGLGTVTNTVATNSSWK